MNIEEHINNLKKYIEEDFAFREPIKNMSDFDKYCYGHCKDIETLLTAYEKEKEKNKEAGVILGKRIKICNEFQLELEKEKEKNKELEKENKKLNILRLELIISQLPDTTETYKKYKKELDELLKEE